MSEEITPNDELETNFEFPKAFWSKEQIEEKKQEFKKQLQSKPPNKGGRKQPYVAFIRTAFEGLQRTPYLDMHVLKCDGSAAQRGVVEYYFRKSLGIVGWWFPKKDVHQTAFKNKFFQTSGHDERATAWNFKDLAGYCKFLSAAADGQDVALERDLVVSERDELLRRVAELEREKGKPAKRGKGTGDAEKPATT